MKILNKLFAFTAITLLLISCQSNPSKSSNGGSQTSQNGSEAKYVFFFIGDGMAAPQVRLAEAALTSDKFQKRYAELTSSQNRIESLRLKEMSITGLATTNAQNRYITCSAAAATALATGNKTDIGIISQTPDGENLQTIAEKAKQKGMKVGIVSSVSIDHATPACFYSHASSRNEYTEISDQLLTSGFDYFGGGSVKWSSRARTEGTDKATAFANYKARAEKLGFNFVTTKAEFDAVTNPKDLPVIATLDMLANEQYSDDGSAMPYTINLNYYDSEDNRISLADFTQKGINLLDNDKGFFMMVEGGKIDWACHANDAATCAYEVVAFDEAIGVALDFATKHPTETLIVVTGDHDCGGLALGFAGTGYESAFDLLANSKISSDWFGRAATQKMAKGDSFQQLLDYACTEFGFTNKEKGDGSDIITSTMELSDYEVKMLEKAYQKSMDKLNKVAFNTADIYASSFGGNDPFTMTCVNMLNNKSGVDFASYSHTAVPVMVFANGANQEIFGGYYDNTDIAKKIMQAAGL